LGDRHRDFFEDLRMLLHGGIPIAQALATVGDGRPGKSGKLAVRLSARLRAGDTLAEALRACGREARPEHIALVAAGERSGTLDHVLGIVVEDMDRRREARRELWKRAAYPLLLFVLAVVLPPLYLLVLGQAGSYLLTVGAVFLPIALIALVVWKGPSLAPHGSGRRASLERALLAVPWAGDLLLERAMGRAFRLLGILHEAGLPLGEAIDHAATAAGLDTVRAELLRVEPRLRAGRSLAQALGESPVLGARPAWTARIAVGEKAGSLEKAFGELGETLEERVHRRLRQVLFVLPVLALLAAGGVIFVRAVKVFTGLLGGL
jgi:type II secretory pathway component PulF